MKPLVYFTILLLIIPVQASLLAPLSLGGIKPDLALVLLYIIGLLTGPSEAALAGMAIGLAQDIGSASFIGFSGLTRGLIGFSAGLLGRRVLDLTSRSNSIFVAAFSLLEGIFIAFFLQMFYGSVPFFSLLAGRILPQALYTGLLGAVVLKLIVRKDVISVLVRRDVQKEF
ncbi:MAG: rod shape-determining protein MreD [Nitrospirae bacterium]|nr:rod shape-determining protein MreD [Nitrospirota bacterium]